MQLRHYVRFFHQEGQANIFTVLFRNPTAFPFWVVVLHEPGHKFRCQSIKPLVPAVFLGVHYAVVLDGPAQVADLWEAQDVLLSITFGGSFFDQATLHEPWFNYYSILLILSLAAIDDYAKLSFSNWLIVIPSSPSSLRQ